MLQHIPYKSLFQRTQLPDPSPSPESPSVGSRLSIGEFGIAMNDETREQLGIIIVSIINCGNYFSDSARMELYIAKPSGILVLLKERIQSLEGSRKRRVHQMKA
jgi:hypothetical protein